MSETFEQSELESPQALKVFEWLDKRLTDLSSNGLKISLADQITARALMLELVVQGADISSGRILDGHLMPVLCRTKDDYKAFRGLRDIDPEIIPDFQVPAGPGPERRTAPAELDQDPVRPFWSKWGRWILGGIAALFVIGVFANLSRPAPPPEEPIERPVPQQSTPDNTSTTVPDTPNNQATEQSSKNTGDAERLLSSVREAADSFTGAPTLEELAGSLISEAPSGWTEPVFAQALHELSGAPFGEPIDIYDVTGAGFQWDRRIAVAIARLNGNYDLTLSNFRDGGIQIVYNSELVLGELVSYFIGRGSDFSEAEFDEDAFLQETPTVNAERFSSFDENGHPGIVRRAAFLAFPDQVDTTPFHRQINVWRMPLWLKLLLSLLPILAALSLLLIRLDRLKGFLRQRKPEISPLETSYFAENLVPSRDWQGRDVALAKSLQARAERQTNRIDIPKTIDATLKTLGEGVDIRFRSLRPAPEYLVLIERGSPNDQTADFLRDLIRPFEIDGQIHFDIYFYQRTPAYAVPESGGVALPIEALQAKHPEHRLIILGTGQGFVRGVKLVPVPVLDALRFWSHRVLLTPEPVKTWTGVQFALARALEAPVARASKDGFLNLAELLGLDGSEARSGAVSRLDKRGDGFMRSLPEGIRFDPDRLLYDHPPEGYPVEDLLRDLRDLMDEEGFDWLSALAVYPALQWDLTLYLGNTLGLYVDDPSGDRRLANLTRLPWLRDGQMPQWLREALIDEMPLTFKGKVYDAIDKILESSLSSDNRLDANVRLDIGRNRLDRPLDPETMEERHKDAVMLDFLKRGDRGDYPLTQGRKRRGASAFLDLLKAPASWRILLAGVALGAAVWFITPDLGSVPVTGAWLPALCLAISWLLLYLLRSEANSFISLFKSGEVGSQGPFQKSFLYRGISVLGSIFDPSPVSRILTGFAWFVFGVVLLGANLTYDLQDPSWNVATDASPTNVFGTPGANLADLFHQLFGWTAIPISFCIFSAGVKRMLLIGRADARKWLCGILSMVFLSVFFAVLPIPITWIFKVSLGGLLGDSIASIVIAPFSALNIERTYTGLLVGVFSILFSIYLFLFASNLLGDVLISLRKFAKTMRLGVIKLRKNPQ